MRGYPGPDPHLETWNPEHIYSAVVTCTRRTWSLENRASALFSQMWPPVTIIVVPGCKGVYLKILASADHIVSSFSKRMMSSASSCGKIS